VDKAIITTLFWLLSFPLLGQDIIPHGQFHKDSVKIGEQLPYSLWVRYAKDKDVAFPDSLFDFSPFELEKILFFNTKSDSLESLDSVVYYFSTFEIDTIQLLTLPIHIINEYDSTTVFTNPDSIILDQVITALPDSVAMLVNTNYQKVPLAFNYPYFTAGIIVLLVAILIIFIVFGRRIHKSIKIFWLSRSHKRYLKSFNLRLEQLPIEVEHTLFAWKKYLEKISTQPYTKFTTKEILGKTNTPSLTLADQLHIIDRYIYGGDKKADTKDAFLSLLQYAISQYNNKIKEIKNG